MSTAPRKAAPRPAKPVARYWRGKAPKGVTQLSESEDEDEVVEAEEQDREQDIDVPLGVTGEQEDEDEEPDEVERRKRAKSTTIMGKMNIALKDVDIKDGKVIVAGREESGKTALEESEEESEVDEGYEKPAVPHLGDESEETSEFESSSEEDEPPKPMFRPVFVPKRVRTTVLEREKEAEDSEEVLERKRLQEEERREQSHDLVAESIRRELAEREKEKETPDIDDTDGLDPDGEFEAWRLRELSRIKRDKEAEAARELEREEIERRRAMPEEQRLREDLDRAKATREAKPKGQQKFLQKYWHKGAFHQDDEVLKKHDYTAPTESTVDVTLLPKVMQVHDFGKRSRTKYTHLLDQDTTIGTGGFGGAAQRLGATTTGGPGTGCFNCGGPHLRRDCPNSREQPRTGSNRTNAAQLTRDWGRDSGHERGRESQSWRDRDREDRSPARHRSKDDVDRYTDRRDDRYRNGRREDRYPDRHKDSGYRDRDSERAYSRRSRSRSPRRRREDRDYYDDRYRRRSRERSLSDDRRGKRIRTD